MELITATDINLKNIGFRTPIPLKFLFKDMKDIHNCRKVTDNIDYVFNMACNMGGMGFIENNKLNVCNLF